MRKLTLFSILSIFGLLFIISCDDDSPAPLELTLNAIPAITIDENPNNGQVLATLSGTTNQGDLAFSLTNQNPAGAMAIDSQSGELTVADSSLFDFEANPTLTATGNVTAEGETKSATITVNLNNVGDVITLSNFTFSIAENPSNGQVIGTVSGTIDVGTLTYSFISNPGSVAMNSNGQITVTDASYFDYESVTTFTLPFKATDGSLETTSEVTINITDVDEKTVQQRLDEGEKPSSILNSGVSIDSLYGKTFAGGLIGEFFTDTKILWIVAKEVVATGQTYSQANTLANNYVTGGYSNWQLPTKGEVNAICNNLTTETKALFPTNEFWTKTGCGGICINTYIFQICNGNGIPSSGGTAAVVVIRKGRE